jgi:hypothetical protein
MVTRPDHINVGRGLILTLSNPGGVHFIPATAPVVQQLDEKAARRLGFVHADAPEYPMYLAQLSANFATFASIGPPLRVIKSSAA